MGARDRTSGWVAIAATLFAILLLAGSCAITASVWKECRAEGRSFFYCVRLVSR